LKYFSKKNPLRRPNENNFLEFSRNTNNSKIVFKLKEIFQCVGPFPRNFSIHAFFQRNQIRQKDEYDNLSLKHGVALIYFDQTFPFFVLLSENERHMKMFFFALKN